MDIVAIRGAITVYNNSKKEILTSTYELLDTIIKTNNLKKDDIILIFTMTRDLDQIIRQ